MSCIEKLGINRVYGVTGRGSLFLTDAVARNKNLEWIAMHHEQSAGFAALAEAQITGRPSVCVVSSGCASTNLITPLLVAWQDFIPVIFISGQHFSAETQEKTGFRVRTFGQQETDVVTLVKSITKFSSLILDKDDFKSTIHRAFSRLTEGRHGPVWLDIPLDIQSAQIDTTGEVIEFRQEVPSRVEPSADDVSYIVEKLRTKKRPLILIGSGVRAAQAGKSIEDMSNRLDLPIVYANTAVDVLTSETRTVVGSIGSLGCSEVGQLAARYCDFLLVLGHRMSSYTTGGDLETFAPKAEVCIVDIDFTEAEAFGLHRAKKIFGDVRKVVEIAHSKLTGFNSRHINWLQLLMQVKKTSAISIDFYKEDERVDLFHLTQSLSKNSHSNSVFVTDSGYPELIIPTNMTVKCGQRFIHPPSQGSMGYALPAAIGVSLNTKSETLVIVGDGSIMMNLQELQIIGKRRLPIVIFIISNDAYGIIRKRQSELFRNRTIGTDSSNGISCPDFQKIAEAFDISYAKIASSNELDEKLFQLMRERDKPIIIEILGKWDQEYQRMHRLQSLLSNRTIEKKRAEMFHSMDSYISESLSSGPF
jgi:acetolactate synthase-1/2/3 large subunit